MKAIFYRILGNDLPPRHSARQTERNLAFVLSHEPPLEGCEKRFLLNRIVDSMAMQRLAGMISQAGYRFDVIPFEPDEYRRHEGFEARFAYLSNNNPARNRAIALGLADGELALPFDGQTCFTRKGWCGLRKLLAHNPTAAFVVVPMFRLRRPIGSLTRWLWLREEKGGESEPQVAFSSQSDIRFNEEIPYGKGPKAELLLRLGVPGPWETWSNEDARRNRRTAAKSRSRHYGRVQKAGFVLRLYSGNQPADFDVGRRAHDRRLGARAIVEQVNRQLGISHS